MTPEDWAHSLVGCLEGGAIQNLRAHLYTLSLDRMRMAMAEAILAEREACLAIVDAHTRGNWDKCSGDEAARSIEAFIRARGKPSPPDAISR